MALHLATGRARINEDELERSRINQAVSAPPKSLSRADKLGLLVGEAPQPFDDFARFDETEQIPGLLASEGSGLLQDPASVENQLKFGVGLTGLNQYQTRGLNVIEDAIATANRRRAAGLKADGKTSTDGRTLSKFDKDYRDTTFKLNTAYRKTIEAPASGIRKFNAINKIIRDRGGLSKMTGADDIAMLKIGMRLFVDENVMADDVVIAKQSQGLWQNMTKDLKNLTENKGTTFTATGRRKLYDALASVAEGYGQEQKNAKANSDTLSEAFGLDPDLVTGQTIALQNKLTFTGKNFALDAQSLVPPDEILEQPPGIRAGRLGSPDPATPAAGSVLAPDPDATKKQRRRARQRSVNPIEAQIKAGIQADPRAVNGRIPLDQRRNGEGWTDENGVRYEKASDTGRVFRMN